MAGQVVGLMVLPLLLGLVVAGVVRLVDTVRSRGVARAAQVRSLAASGATGLAGLAATLAWLAWPDGLSEDLRMATLPALVCAVAVLTAAVAELTWPRPGGPVRTANLAARRPARPVWLGRLVVAGLIATAAALVVGTLTAAPDGRSFERTSGGVVSSGSPYPGWSYAVAVGSATLLLALATWFARARVDARPTLGPGREVLDAAVRGASTVRVLRPAAVGSLTTAAGLWLSIGTTVNRVTQTLRINDAGAPEPPFDWVQNLGFAAIAVGLGLLVLAVAALLSGSPRLPREDTVVAGDAARVRA